MRVSIALCTYNGANFIAAQLASILGQSRCPDEIIVRDDGSTDGTIEIIESIISNASVPIRFTRNDRNLGVTRNFAAAIGDCTGDVIFLSDQDDVWFENKIETMLGRFDAEGSVGLVYCDAAIVDAAMLPSGLTVFQTRGKSRVWMGDDRYPEELIYKPNIKGCTMAIAARFLPYALPIPDDGSECVWSHDYWLAFMLSCIAKTRVVDAPLMYYRIHENNTSGLVGPGSRARDPMKGRPRIKYATSMLEWRIRLYSLMLKRLRSLPLKDASIDFRKIDVYKRLLESEFMVLSRRMHIWAERSMIKRIGRAISYLFSGKYIRFKYWPKQVLKDIIGIHVQTPRGSE